MPSPPANKPQQQASSYLPLSGEQRLHELLQQFAGSDGAQDNASPLLLREPR